MNPAPSPLWKKNPALAWREMDDETVIISPGESIMHELNHTAGFIWRHLNGAHSAAEIAAMVAAEYDVAPDVALADTQALLEQLAQQNLLLPAGEQPGTMESR